MARYSAPRNVGLDFEQWPQSVQQAWTKALEPGDVFSDAGGLSHLAPKTIRTVKRALEKWLFYVKHKGELTPELGLADTVNRENLSDYIKGLRLRLKNVSVCTQLRSLSQAFNALCPDADRTLVQQAIGRLRQISEPTRVETKQLPPLHALVTLGQELMDSWKKASFHDKNLNAIQYRDGLILTWLCRMPLRVENLAETSYWSTFAEGRCDMGSSVPASSMKNRRALDLELPPALAIPLEIYLDEVRPILMEGKGDQSILWPSYHHRAMSESGISTAVKRCTSKGLNMSTTPHDIRHIVATTLAEIDPSLARVAAGVLQHRSQVTTEDYYIRAKYQKAGRNYQSAIERIADEVEGANKLQRRLDEFLGGIADDDD